jgi:hypothetical protein
MVYIIGNNSYNANTVTNERDIWFALENKDIIDAEGTMRYQGSVLRPANTSNNGHWRAFELIPSGSNATFWDYNEGIFIPFTVTTPANPTWFRDDNAYTDNWEDYTYEMNNGNFASVGASRPFYQIGDSIFFGDSQDQWNIAVTSEDGGIDVS